MPRAKFLGAEDEPCSLLGMKGIINAPAAGIRTIKESQGIFIDDWDANVTGKAASIFEKRMTLKFPALGGESYG